MQEHFMKDALLGFFERVTVETADETKSHLNGLLGTVLGRSFIEDEDRWYYAVCIDRYSETWALLEEELKSCGQFVAREEYYDGTRLRVQVDEHGRGKIVSEDEETQ